MLAKILTFNKTHTKLASALRIATAIFMIILSAKLTLPWYPVPLTFQSVTVLFLAMSLPLSESIAAVTGYILLGVFGFPVFAGSIAGAAVLLGTTGGYIFGFLLATIVCGALYTQWGVKNFSTYLMLSLLGVVLIFICGVAVLANFMGVKMAYALGVQPFLFTESMKIVLLASVLSLKNAF